MQPEAPVSDAPPRDHREEVIVCTNCRGPLDGAFCAACGQKATPLRQPIHRFLADAIVEYFGIDGRLWTSLKLLLLRPGRLTQEYLAGRRVRYLRPLRIYLSATLVFFFLLTLLDPVGRVAGFIAQGDEAAPEAMAAGDRVAELDSVLAAEGTQFTQRERVVDSLRARSDSLRMALDATASPKAMEAFENELADVLHELNDETDDLARLRNSESRQRRLGQLRWQRDQLAAFPPDSMVRIEDWDRAAEILFPEDNVDIDLPAWMPRSRPVQRLTESRTGEERGEALADLGRRAIGQLPTVMFLLLPIFALLLKLIYVRRDWYYSEHLVFALHTHAFAFVVFTVVTVLLWVGGDAVWSGVVTQLLLFGIPIYFFVAQKRVYGQGWIKTGVKALLLGWVYGFLLSLGLVLAVLLASAV